MVPNFIVSGNVVEVEMLRGFDVCFPSATIRLSSGSKWASALWPRLFTSTNPPFPLSAVSQSFARHHNSTRLGYACKYQQRVGSFAPFVRLESETPFQLDGWREGSSH